MYGSLWVVLPVAGLHLIECWLLSEFKYVLIFFTNPWKVAWVTENLCGFCKQKRTNTTESPSHKPIKTALKRVTPKEKQNSCRRNFEFIALRIYDAGVSVSGQLVGSVFVWALLWSHTPKYRIEKMSRRIWHLTCDYSTISSLIFGKNFLFKIQLFSVISCP